MVPAENNGEGTWATAPIQGLPSANGISTLPQAEQIFFTAFFSSQNTAVLSYNGKAYIVTNDLASMEAPYTPTRVRVRRLSWQVNDPLVHYLASDLLDSGIDTNGQSVVDIQSYVGQLNDRYMPWGGNPQHQPNASTPDDPNLVSQYNTAMKDPWMYSSDDWAFPTNKFPTTGWLGRVHRGTPWQTVYLKSADIAANNLPAWRYWTGYGDNFDAEFTAPAWDRLLFDVFTTAINDNATTGQMSVNVDANPTDPAAGLAAWSALFSGIAVPASVTNSYAVINPAGVAAVASPLWQLVTNINSTRSFYNNANGTTGGAFQHVGDILAASTLTEQSPFLAATPTNGVSDALMEWLPQQMMSLLRVSSAPRYVIYSYGQTLKPAPGGVVTSSSFFGLVTNYQVVAESATRALVQVNAVLNTNANGTLSTNYNTKIEQFNVLPPD
jgi:hypothetical protein